MLILMLTLHLSEFERHVRASHVVSNVCRVTYGLIYYVSTIDFQVLNLAQMSI